jgi:transposase-like protein
MVWTSLPVNWCAVVTPSPSEVGQPKSRREDLYERLKAAWDSKEYEKAWKKLDEISEVYQDKYPELAEFISEHGWETLGVYDAAPVEHHKRLRTTNMIERVNQELKRRSKVVRIFPNTSSCRRLFSALLKECKPSVWYIFHGIVGSSIFGRKESHEQNGT